MNIYNILDDMIQEQAQAKKGNWKGSSNMLGEVTKFVIDKYYTKIDKITISNDEYILYKNDQHKNKDNYILGQFNTKNIETKLGIESKIVFDIFFGITFTKLKNTKTYGIVYNVDGVAVTNYGKGLSSFMYKYFVKEMNLTIIGDSEQYFGARKLWSLLSKELDLIVDIYDIKNDKIIEEDVILYHGDYNNNFDTRLWSFSKSKHNIRSILKDIK